MAPDGIRSYRPAVMGAHHAVSSGHYLASAAALSVLERGGTAVDAGVAMGLALNVTLPNSCNFGGVAPIMIYRAKENDVVTISGLGRWPQSVTLESYREKYNNDIPVGIPRAVVPSACDAWLTALELYGTLSFEQVALPALQLAGEGFPVSHGLARSFARTKALLAQWPGDRAVYMPGGEPLKGGERLVQAELADVFARMIGAERAAAAKNGRAAGIQAARDYFYKGPVAERMVEFSREGGGMITREDFADFHVKVEPPEVGSYKNYGIYTCGPWCQGPALIQVLNLLEGYDLAGMGLNSPDYIHTVAEAVNLAFADREAFYGDPEFVNVPMRGLLSKEFAAERRKLLRDGVAWPEMPPAGDPWPYQGEGACAAPPAPEEKSGPRSDDTTYGCVVDRGGTAVSATPSDPMGGSPIVPGLGMLISWRGSQTWLDPQHPCALAPWKRPRLTPNPSIAFRDGKLWMPFGTPGGDNQVQGMAQMFLNMAEFGMDVQSAIEAPRFSSFSFPDSFWPHTYSPGLLVLEGRLSSAQDDLAGRGHRVETRADWAPLATGLCAVMVDQENGSLVGGADPRGDAYAIAR